MPTIQSLSLRSGAVAVAPNSIGSTQLKSGAIGSSVYLGAAVVTPSKVTESLKTVPWWANETEGTGTSTNFVTRKSYMFVRSGTAGIPFNYVKILYELKRAVGSVGSVMMRMTFAGSPTFTSPYVDSGTYSLRSGSMNISYLKLGSPVTLAMQTRSSIGVGTPPVYQRLLEIYAYPVG